ncbi:pilus assembly protein PilM [Patescibacteria group bacterium]|nr:pilus assembly protein PilM [Patescibacteria group bacterium]MBU1673011.1 pilus assembly protein PilM [Patescibacteria group bacterium]MBU1964170.1 pilus assembly protein PilM [Patescibacteria group bacterium]
MALFGGSESYIGVDIGSSSIKVCELQNEKGRAKLLTYGYLEQKNDLLKAQDPENIQKVADSVKKLCEKSKTTSKKAIGALPSFTVFSSIINLPEMPKKELEAAVEWEAKKFVPMPLEEMILDWKQLENTDKKAPAPAPQETMVTAQNDKNNNQEKKIQAKEEKSLRILLTAAPQKLVTKYMEIFQKAGLEIVSLETEAFALERSLVGHDPSPVMIVDIGASTTSIIITRSSVPIINRSIDLGGESITKTIANSLNILPDRAEQFKRDYGLSLSQEETSQVPKRIEFMISSIVNEIRYVLNLYASQNEGTVEKIVLAGGSSWLPNLPQYLNKVLNLKVFIGDPWARVIYPTDLKPVLQELGPRMAVSVGLAMRQIHT